ncbi:MAG: metal-dependent hydrolase [Gemmatimonadetes bacterium]|nr:metal-dependent hydrolase [Gemmatimonadota bacterium]
MQLGHVPLALSIASFNWSPKMALFCLGIHYLPNADSLVVRAGFAKPDFHCTLTHSFTFAFVVTGIVYLIAPAYAPFAFVALVTHYAADIGSTVGLPLLWPFSKKRFTLALFKDTGYWGWEMYRGYYRQPMAWVLEGAVLAFFTWRATVVFA